MRSITRRKGTRLAGFVCWVCWEVVDHWVSWLIRPTSYRASYPNLTCGPELVRALQLAICPIACPVKASKQGLQIIRRAHGALRARAGILVGRVAAATATAAAAAAAAATACVYDRTGSGLI